MAGLSRQVVAELINLGGELLGIGIGALIFEFSSPLQKPSQRGVQLDFAAFDGDNHGDENCSRHLCIRLRESIRMPR
jgi:hypothetical protein